MYAEMPRSHEQIYGPEPAVIHQMQNVLELRRQRLLLRQPEAEQIINKETAFLNIFYHKALYERVARADDVQSQEIQAADSLAKSLLSFSPYRIGCIDGRNNYVFVAGLTPGVGGDYPVPAGDPKEFVEDHSGELVLLKGSNYASALDDIVSKQNGKVPTIVLDSHIECAAQALSESGKKPSDKRGDYHDHGLLADVQRKRKIKDAIYKYRDTYHVGKNIDVNQISYDPTTNYLYMGLAKEHATQYAKANGGFTTEVLNDLAEQDLIISTQHIVNGAHFQAEFEQRLFTPDWQKNYRETGFNFWRGMEELSKTDLLNSLSEKVRNVFPNTVEVTDQEVKTRAQLLLMNCYAGYLNNQAGIVANKHTEQWVVVATREYGPFDSTSGFQVSSHSSDIPGDVALGNGIVLKNRKLQTVNDITGIYNGDYLKAPLAYNAQVIDKLQLPDWEAISKVDFSDLAHNNWRVWNTDEFRKYLKGKYAYFTDEGISLLNQLREKAAEMLRPGGPTADQIMNGDLHTLYTVTDSKRRPLFAFPLEYFGYANQK